MSGMIGARKTPPKHKSVEWYTPAWIFERLSIEFDLDPSSPHDYVTAVPAKTKYTIFDDGLSKPWIGRVWMNPPYGPDTGFWMRRLISHGDGIALVFSRTDAEWFQEAMASASATLLVRGRIAFVPSHENSHKKGRSGAGSAMFAFGEKNATALQQLADLGVMIPRFRSEQLNYRRPAAIWSITAAEAANAARLFHLDCALSVPYKSPPLSTLPPQ